MRTTNMRFTGLASGLDTESMVKAMIMPYQNKVDKSKQDKMLLELKKDAWKEINSKVYKFHTETLSKLRLEGSFNKKSTTISQEGVVELGSGMSFPDGTHKLEVEKVAEGATLQAYRTKNKKDTILTLEPGETITISSGEPSKEKTIKLNANNKAEYTLGDLESELKEAIGEQYNVKFDEGLGTFFISSKNTGVNQKIAISGTEKTMKAAGLVSLDVKADPTGKVITAAKGDEAIIKYNGIEIKSESNIVNVNGLELKIIGQGTTTIMASRDTDTVVESIKGFVNEYNELIDTINKLVDAPYNKDYRPLTDEQKKEMSEEDIKLWNKKINDSILRNDPTLKQLANTMRDVMGGTTVEIDGKKMTLASIGIATGKDWNEKGKLYIDEDKLREVINSKPDVVTELFAQKSDKGNKGGIATRFYNELSNLFKGTDSKSSNFLFNDRLLDKKIKDENENTIKLEEQLVRMEDMYYKQFAAMEKMLGQLNNQSNWLTGQLGGM